MPEMTKSYLEDYLGPLGGVLVNITEKSGQIT